jgi:ABC-type phosphate/phosphonate transport system substrate-binding protein
MSKRKKACMFFLPVLTLLLMAGISCIVVHAADGQKMRFRAGYSIKTLPEVDVKDATAALKVWAKEVGDRYGFQVETVIYESLDGLAQDLQSGKIDFAVFDVLDYLSMEQKINIKPDLTRFKDNKPTVRYMLLVNSGDQRTNLATLRGKRLSVLRNNSMGTLFLNTQLLRAHLPEASIFFNIQEKGKESQAILSVFFGQADACVVTNNAFRVAAELNPQISVKLKVFAVSPDLVEMVGVFRKDPNKELKERAMFGMRDMQSSPRGKQIMLLYNTEKMDLINEGQLDSVRNLFAEYRRLSGKK